VGDRVYATCVFRPVPAAFQGVEDNLAALRILEEETRVQAEAVDAARESARITTNQYRAGTVPYLNVITAQAILLSNEVTLINLQGRRMAAFANPSKNLLRVIIAVDPLNIHTGSHDVGDAAIADTKDAFDQFLLGPLKQSTFLTGSDQKLELFRGVQ